MSASAGEGGGAGPVEPSGGVSSGAASAGVGTRPSWRGLYEELASALRAHENEARLILVASASRPWSYIAAHFDEPATPDAIVVAHRMVAERHLGEPLQWVLGTWDFRTIEVGVDRRALIPRPESETVVEVALGEIDRLSSVDGVRPGGTSVDGPLVLDLGTGSGVIALSIAAERPEVSVVAVDRSPSALELARENLARVEATQGGSFAERLRFLEGDWYEPLESLRPSLRSSFDVIVSNPPYVTDAEWRDLDPVVRDHDPYEALVSGPAGTEAIEIVVTGAPAWLRPGGAVAVEIAPQRAGEALSIATAAGLKDAQILKDLTGRDRVLLARREG